MWPHIGKFNPYYSAVMRKSLDETGLESGSELACESDWGSESGAGVFFVSRIWFLARGDFLNNLKIVHLIYLLANTTQEENIVEKRCCDTQLIPCEVHLCIHFKMKLWGRDCCACGVDAKILFKSKEEGKSSLSPLSDSTLVSGPSLHLNLTTYCLHPSRLLRDFV